MEATTIPGRKVLLDLPPKAVVVGTPSRHHRKRQTQSGSSLVSGPQGWACLLQNSVHPHDASTGPMMATMWSRPLNKPFLGGCPGGTGISRASCGRPTPDR